VGKKRVPLFIDAYVVGECEVGRETDFVVFSPNLMTDEARKFLLPKPTEGWVPQDNHIAEYVCAHCGNRIWIKLPFTPNPEKVPCVRPGCFTYCGPNINYVPESISDGMSSFFEAMKILGVECDLAFWNRYHSDALFHHIVNAAWAAWESKCNPPKALFNLNEKPPWLHIDHL